MPRVITDGTPIEGGYEPPPPPPRRGELGEGFVQALSQAILLGFRSLPAPVVNVEAPVVNVPKPEVKVNSPVYVTAPEVKVPAMTVNVPEGKAPVVNIEPASVTLKTERPSKWKFTFNRDEFGRLITAECEDISKK